MCIIGVLYAFAVFSRPCILIGADYFYQLAVSIVILTCDAAVALCAFCLTVHEIIFNLCAAPLIVCDGYEVPSFIIHKPGRIVNAAGLVHMPLRYQAVCRVVLPQDLRACREERFDIIAVLVVFIFYGHAVFPAAFPVRGAFQRCHAPACIIGIAKNLLCRAADPALFIDTSVVSIIAVLKCRTCTVAHPDQPVVRVISIVNGVYGSAFALLCLVLTETALLRAVPRLIICILCQSVERFFVLHGYGDPALHKPPQAVVSIQLPCPLFIGLPRPHPVRTDDLGHVSMQIIHIPPQHCPVGCRGLHHPAHPVIRIGIAGPAVCLRIILCGTAYLY